MSGQSYSEEDFREHMETEHKQTPFSEYLREIVYGGIDGIVTTFAVVAGFTGAQVGNSTAVGGSFLTVLLFGFANLFADAVSMGLGNFLSVRSQQDVYRGEKKKELRELRESRGMEKEETKHILRQKGYSSEQAVRLTELLAANEDYWLQFMMREELRLPNPEGENPYLTGLTTFSSFITFGLIPLLPYLLFCPAGVCGPVFELSVLFTAAALTLLGLLRWKVTQEKFRRSLLETVILGGVSALIAYFVGTLFAG